MALIMQKLQGPFIRPSDLDTTCAMCYWGYAFVLGPNYNAGMDPGHYERAFEAMSSANKYAAVLHR